MFSDEFRRGILVRPVCDLRNSCDICQLRAYTSTTIPWPRKLSRNYRSQLRQGQRHPGWVAFFGAIPSVPRNISFDSPFGVRAVWSQWPFHRFRGWVQYVRRPYWLRLI